MTAQTIRLKPATPFSENMDPKKFIIIKGARVNNLKNLSVAIPRYKLVVITGLSGSGKSSLAFDTLYAEGQRMYVESLSSYARQFLGRMEKPEVDYIRGVSPAIAIEQKVNTKNPRSTVGTTTEIYDYFKLLFSRVGKTFSPVSGLEVGRDSVETVVSYLQTLAEGIRVMIMAPFKQNEDRDYETELKILLQKGFTRMVQGPDLLYIEEMLEGKLPKRSPADTYVLIDRASINKDEEDNQFRLADSVQTAWFEGDGVCVLRQPNETDRIFSERFEQDGIAFEVPSINFFSFNNPYGACKTCDGFGKILGIDEDLIIPDKSLSVFEGAIACWKGDAIKLEWLTPLLKNGIKFDFPIYRPWIDLTDEERKLVWDGNKYFNGLHSFFQFLEENSYKIQYRVMLSRFRGRKVCPDCRGTRLRKDASYVKLGGKSITDLVLMPIHEVAYYFRDLQLTDYEFTVSKQIVNEVKSRLSYMLDVGLGYLTLNRLTSTLSGGEYQRIKLATSLGSALVGSMYILDEPSIGLHPRDTERLIKVLVSLRDLGNTVIVVEHEEEVMQAADQIIDIGPDAGSHGGNLLFQMDVNTPDGSSITGLDVDSHTFKYLMGTETIAIPTQRRPWSNYIEVLGARENNLKNVSVKFPLGVLTVVTGVSGSGKSTLVKKVLYPALARVLGISFEEGGKYDRLEGRLKKVEHIEFVDQNPIGKSSRSNPVTYIKAYDAIRNLYADQPLSKTRGYGPGHFSFNIDGGRCEVCQGEGEVKIEMQFMADIYLKCDSCHGARFKQDILEVTYNEKHIADILDLTIADAIPFFSEKPKIAERLQPLADVGLGYVKLGQSSNTLSGGEAQRVKLASFLGKSSEKKENILFIFDEPTTGLHFHDISKLLKAINALIEQGNTVIIIEHNMDVIKTADWIIDLGPDGGDNGGTICFEGMPEDMVKLTDNYTAQFLAEKLR
jgi:excinuclease ABC subunit A